MIDEVDLEKFTGTISRSWLVLRRDLERSAAYAAQFVAELKFRVLEIDPTTAEVEGDEDGLNGIWKGGEDALKGIGEGGEEALKGIGEGLGRI